ncbi:hypothetical protein OAO66_00850 [Flavobacteriaceae bacterium]|jgi:hypothetical protein|nr:hypothetical protein [Flavobacteriaceae bacterium]
MKNSKINIGKALFQTLNLLILKQFTLPFKIYKNSLINLSNSESQDSAESTLSDDFPLYVWYVNIFDALIFWTYPIGIIVFIFTLIDNNDDAALPVLFATYFMPLFFGLFKEIISIALRMLQYLKTISKK